MYGNIYGSVDCQNSIFNGYPTISGCCSMFSVCILSMRHVVYGCQIWHTVWLGSVMVRALAINMWRVLPLTTTFPVSDHRQVTDTHACLVHLKLQPYGAI